MAKPPLAKRAEGCLQLSAIRRCSSCSHVNIRCLWYGGPGIAMCPGGLAQAQLRGIGGGRGLSPGSGAGSLHVRQW
jgi:hypothetical protein